MTRDTHPEATSLRLLEVCSDLVLIIDHATTQVLWSNRALDDWTGSSHADSPYLTLADVLPDLATHVGADPNRVIATGSADPVEVDFELHDAAGRPWPTRAQLQPVDFLGHHALGVVIPTPAGHPSSAQRASAGYCDSVTGLADRSVLVARLQALLSGDRAADREFTVLFIDLDGFKQVNDRCGHVVGDRLLGEAARRISNCIRATDKLVRYGGDEFVALLESTNAAEAGAVVERIRNVLSGDFPLVNGARISLSASIGVVESDARFRTPEDVVVAADEAMYRAKRASMPTA